MTFLKFWYIFGIFLIKLFGIYLVYNLENFDLFYSANLATLIWCEFLHVIRFLFLFDVTIVFTVIWCEFLHVM